MQTLQIHDLLASERIVVDPRAVLTMLGERAVRASWQIDGVARYGEAIMVTGAEAADRLEALSRSPVRVPGSMLSELVHQTAQIIWGEFTAFEERQDVPWVIVRAIDSSWCEIESDDEDVLDLVRRTFSDVRAAF
jgi:hypothetical protein